MSWLRAMPGDLFVALPPSKPYHEELGRNPGKLRIGLLTHDPLIEGLKAVQPDILAIHSRCVAPVEGTRRFLESFRHIVEGSSLPARERATGLRPRYLGVIRANATAAALDAWCTRTGRTIGPDDVEPCIWALK